MEAVAGGVMGIAPKVNDHDHKQIVRLKIALQVAYLMLLGLAIGFGWKVGSLTAEINDLKTELHRDDTYLKSNDFDQRFIEEVSDIKKIMYSEIANQNQAIKGNVTLMDAKITNIDGKVEGKVNIDDHWVFEITQLINPPYENYEPLLLPTGYEYKQCKFMAGTSDSPANLHTEVVAAFVTEVPYAYFPHAISAFPNTAWYTGFGIAFCNKNYLNPNYINWPAEYQ